MSKISIVIPAYKQAHFLAQAIESALGQTHGEIEVVVIDDGSPDNTGEVAARYGQNPKLKYVRQNNTGLPEARNRGIRESSGEYICFLDSDDYFVPEKVAKQAALLDANPALGFVYCDIISVDESGRKLSEQYSVAQSSRELSGNLFEALILGGYFPPHTVMIRKSICEQVGGFDRDLGGHADYEFWLRVSGAGYKAEFVPEALAYYRIHGSNMSKNTEHMRSTRIATLRKIAHLYPDLVGAGIDHLQQGMGDLFAENQRMRHLQEAPEADASSEAEAGEDFQSYSLLRHFGKARRGKGREDQAAIWDVTIDGRQDRGIYMQPPVDLTFRVPTGERGRFQSAVCVHPLAWDKPGAGGCEFHLRIDSRVVHVVALDPVNIPADRHWHELAIAVPERADGFHEISIEVRPIGGSNAYRWGIWRAPKFSYVTVSAPLNPPITAQ